MTRTEELLNAITTHVDNCHAEAGTAGNPIASVEITPSPSGSRPGVFIFQCALLLEEEHGPLMQQSLHTQDDSLDQALEELLAKVEEEYDADAG